MVHDLKRHYDGYDAKCRKCGATYRAFCCVNVGSLCNGCFRDVLDAYWKQDEAKRLRLTPLTNVRGLLI